MSQIMGIVSALSLSSAQKRVKGGSNSLLVESESNTETKSHSKREDAGNKRGDVSLSTKTDSRKSSRLRNSDVLLTETECSPSKKACISDTNLVEACSVNKRLHICDLCNKEFSSRRVLYKHQKFHSWDSESPDTGNETVSASENLSDAKPVIKEKADHPTEQIPQSSSEAKEYPTCDICFRRFSTRKTLYRHRRNIHAITNTSPPVQKPVKESYPSVPVETDNSKPFSCDICHKGFSTRKTLGKHKRNIHGNFSSNTLLTKQNESV